MPMYVDEIERLAEEFESCRSVLLALGDENRQHLILEMMRIENCNGVRVGESWSVAQTGAAAQYRRKRT